MTVNLMRKNDLNIRGAIICVGMFSQYSADKKIEAMGELENKRCARWEARIKCSLSSVGRAPFLYENVCKDE